MKHIFQDIRFWNSLKLSQNFYCIINYYIIFWIIYFHKICLKILLVFYRRILIIMNSRPVKRFMVSLFSLWAKNDIGGEFTIALAASVYDGRRVNIEWRHMNTKIGDKKLIGPCIFFPSQWAMWRQRSHHQEFLLNFEALTIMILRMSETSF